MATESSSYRNQRPTTPQFGAWALACTPAATWERNATVGPEPPPRLFAASSPDRAGYQCLHLPTGSQPSIRWSHRRHLRLAGAAGPGGGNLYHHHDGVAGAAVSGFR